MDGGSGGWEEGVELMGFAQGGFGGTFLDKKNKRQKREEEEPSIQTVGLCIFLINIWITIAYSEVLTKVKSLVTYFYIFLIFAEKYYVSFGDWLK